MKTIPWKILLLLAFGIGLLALGVWGTVSRSSEPDLSKAICQPNDLGEYFHYSNRLPVLTKSYLDLGERVVESYTVELVDLQVSYLVLECSIVRYADEAAARQAFEQVCGEQSKQNPATVGEEACDFVGPAPHNLAFRRDAHLVLMSGDVVPTFPATAVDERLH